MKQLLIFLLILTTLASCQRTGTLNQKFIILSQEEFLKDNYDSTITTLAILDKYTLSVKAISKKDTGNIFYGIQDYYDDSLYRHINIGKLIDSTRIFATEINTRDNYINFYTFKGNKWKKLGTEEINEITIHLRFEDLNGDNNNEIITSTFGNMNGISYHKIYIFDSKLQLFNQAGTLYSNVPPKLNKLTNQIHEISVGSFHDDDQETIYKWVGNILIPSKRIEVAKDRLYYINAKETFEYYENHTDSANGLKLIFSKPYNNNDTLQTLWEKFFERNGIE